ncbi:hypothetical protein MTO96_000451 [Rhipicephalus appendiculatus]
MRNRSPFPECTAAAAAAAVQAKEGRFWGMLAEHLSIDVIGAHKRDGLDRSTESRRFPSPQDIYDTTPVTLIGLAFIATPTVCSSSNELTLKVLRKNICVRATRHRVESAAEVEPADSLHEQICLGAADYYATQLPATCTVERGKAANVERDQAVLHR